MKYPSDLKCRECGKKKGDHQAEWLMCPLGRIKQFQQFHGTQFFRPVLPKIPLKIASALMGYQESVAKDAEWTRDQEYLRWRAFYEIKQALEARDGKATKPTWLKV